MCVLNVICFILVSRRCWILVVVLIVLSSVLVYLVLLSKLFVVNVCNVICCCIEKGVFGGCFFYVCGFCFCWCGGGLLVYWCFVEC